MKSRTQQHRAFQQGMDLLELKLRVQAGAARNAYLRRSAKAYELTGSVAAHLSATHQARLQIALADHSMRTGDYFGKLALSSIKRGRKAALTPVQALMADWVKRQALAKAKMIADTDRDDVAGAIQDGLDEGLGTAEIATRIRRLTALTPYRAALIARTETHAAATYGSIDSVRDAENTLGIRMLKSWLPTSDTRTRPEHLAMRSHPAIPLGEKFTVGGEPMDRPGDPAASPGNTINCLHPDSVIDSGHIKAMTRHWYEGELVTIETASGKRLSVTPNHPILTREGWVAAAALEEGGSVIGGRGFERVRLGDLDVENIEGTAEEMFDSLRELRAAVRVPNVSVDFHGEVPDGDVDIVNAAGELGGRGKPSFYEPFDHLVLACTDLCSGRLLSHRLLYGVGVMKFGRLGAHRLVRLGRELQAFVRGGLGHPGVHALAAISGANAQVIKAKPDVLAGDTERGCQRFDGFARLEPLRDLPGIGRSLGPRRQPAGIALLAKIHARFVEPVIDGLRMDTVLARKLNDALAREVFLDQIVNIGHSDYRGFVYNAETHKGYYICNGVVQHNCRCSLVFEEAE